mmetsp:Transcript_22004/g.61260  ORF Transcript_22004/g.61260 Transcript_22004/m.61260 type:complete len:388 (-) Transcript_22004:766-1929(-)
MLTYRDTLKHAIEGDPMASPPPSPSGSAGHSFRSVSSSASEASPSPSFPSRQDESGFASLEASIVSTVNTGSAADRYHRQQQQQQEQQQEQQQQRQHQGRQQESQQSSSCFSSYYAISPHPMLVSDGALSFTTEASRSVSAMSVDSAADVNSAANRNGVPSSLLLGSSGTANDDDDDDDASLSYLSVRSSMITSSILPSIADVSEADNGEWFDRSAFEAVGRHMAQDSAEHEDGSDTEEVEPSLRDASTKADATPIATSTTQQHSQQQQNEGKSKTERTKLGEWLQIGTVVVGVTTLALLLVFGGGGKADKTNRIPNQRCHHRNSKSKRERKNNRNQDDKCDDSGIRNRNRYNTQVGTTRVKRGDDITQEETKRREKGLPFWLASDW